MRKSRFYLFAVLCLEGCCLWAQTATSPMPARSGDVAVTAVSGESWLTHLNRSFGDSSMGRTGRIGAAPGREEGNNNVLLPVSTPSATGSVMLRGSDLYRLNCWGCHGQSGLGAPPEINSIINPVRATSVAVVMERMKNAGMDISRADAGKLAQQSNVALLQRLHQGGESMPAFSLLSEAEIRSLLAYLKQLADVPGANNGQMAVTESHVRVGELIVKSTCHTCHSALGPDPGPQELLGGAIPPLSTLTRRKNEPEFIRKVTQGAPVLMGTPPSLCRGRMPVFFYLSEQEAADVYLYLTRYPPSEHPTATPLMATLQNVQPPSDNGPSSPTALLVPNERASAIGETTNRAGVPMEALPWTEAVVALLLAGGLVFTLREFRRLSSKSAERNVSARKPRRDPDLGWPLGPIREGSIPRLLDATKRGLH